MKNRLILLPPLFLCFASGSILSAADSEFSGLGPSGQWKPSTVQQGVAVSIEDRRAGYYQSRVTPPAPGQAEQPGYRVVVQVAFDESGTPLDAQIHASDDNTPGEMLN